MSAPAPPNVWRAHVVFDAACLETLRETLRPIATVRLLSVPDCFNEVAVELVTADPVIAATTVTETSATVPDQKLRLGLLATAVRLHAVAHTAPLNGWPL